MSNTPEKKYKLYHRLADPASAEIRVLVKELGLLENLQFANIEVGEKDLGELQAGIGRIEVPTLRWNGEWVVGKDAIAQRLRMKP